MTFWLLFTLHLFDNHQLILKINELKHVNNRPHRTDATFAPPDPHSFSWQHILLLSVPPNWNLPLHWFSYLPPFQLTFFFCHIWKHHWCVFFQLLPTSVCPVCALLCSPPECSITEQLSFCPCLIAANLLWCPATLRPALGHSDHSVPKPEDLLTLIC